MSNTTNHKHIAKLANECLNSPQVINYIAENMQGKTNKRKVISNVYGNLLHYIVATRDNKITKNMLEVFNPHEEVGFNFNAGKEVTQTLLNQLSNSNQTNSVENLLKLLQKNMYDNAVFMHAFNNIFKNSISSHGFDNTKNVSAFKEGKERLGAYIDYPYSHNANKHYATGDFAVLYGYGTISPEWFFYMVKNERIVEDREKNLAYDEIIKNVKVAHPNLQPNILNTLSQDAKLLSNYILDDKNDMSIAVLNSSTTTETGEPIYPEYKLKEWLKPEHFSKTYVEEFFRKNNLEINVNSNDNTEEFTKNFGLFVNHLVNISKIYEVSTVHNINKENFTIFSIPNYKQFKNQSDQIKETENSKTL